MNVIEARNANQALPEMCHLLTTGKNVATQSSRNGQVRRFIAPTAIHYQRPRERVVFWAERDANPFFHLFESLWMLAGRNDVAYPARFAKQIAQYSDDGATFHGAYGHRWRNHFGFDQLYHIANGLRVDKTDRRHVLQMWDARADGNGKTGKDFPCNIEAVFNRDDVGRLNMVVFNRSNDMIWGALGANCVHFSVLQEFLAKWIGCEVGEYWQISANMHAYEFNSQCVAPLADKAFPSTQYKSLDPYEAMDIRPFPLVSGDISTWQSDLSMFLSEGSRAMGYRDPFFRRVACPLEAAYNAFSERSNPGRFEKAFNLVNQVAPCDWKLACAEWLLRRKEAWEKRTSQTVAE